MPSRLSLGLHNPNWHHTSSHASNGDFISAVVAAVSRIPVSSLPCHVIINLMMRNYRLLLLPSFMLVLKALVEFILWAGFHSETQRPLTRAITQPRIWWWREPFTDTDRNTVRIVDNRIYSAKVLRVNYTTYDVRRGQDSMNPRTEHCDVMVHSREDDLQGHPYWYARVLGVFHARVLHTGPAATNRSIQNMEFVLVRWFGRAPDHHSGWQLPGYPRSGLWKTMTNWRSDF